MNKNLVIRISASATGLAGLFVIVTVLIAWAFSGKDYLAAAVTCNLFMAVIALAAWNGLLSRGDKSVGLNSCGEWLAGFFVGAVMTTIFALMDCGGELPSFHPEFACKGHPGIGMFFTVAAACLTVVALPSALRAWIIQRFAAESSMESANHNASLHTDQQADQ
jgi:hypothetical protein